MPRIAFRQRSQRDDEHLPRERGWLRRDAAHLGRGASLVSGGSRIAFLRPGSGIYVIDSSGGNERFLGPGFEPTWSPDGTQIAFSSGGSGATDGIYVMSAGRWRWTSLRPVPERPLASSTATRRPELAALRTAGKGPSVAAGGPTRASSSARDATRPQSEGSGLERLRGFFGQRIWAVRLDRLGHGRALIYRASRIAYASVHGFVAHRLTVRAAALTYYTVLSVVPFLAFAFAVLKGFGAYTSFIDGTARPYLDRTFGGNPALLGSIDRILQFVDRTNVSALGAVGLVTLVYTSVSLLGSVEDILNEIWGARTRRSFLRQVTDYVTLLVTTPLLLVAATTAASAAQSSRVVVFLRDALSLGSVIDFLLHFTSLATVGLAFFAVYMILPNVRTRPVSALLGAAVAAVLWQAALIAYVRFQIGVSSYNALYSVLSAIPIFLVWTYVSWIVLLVGAEVAGSHQNERVLRQQLRSSHLDQALRETIGVVLMAHVVRDFVTGAPRRDTGALATAVDSPEVEVQDILDALTRGGVLVKADARGNVGYVPARDIDTMRVSDVRAALRRDAAAEELRGDVERHLGRKLRDFLAAVEDGTESAPQNITLRELAFLVEPGPDRFGADETPRILPDAPAEAPVRDGK